MWRVPERVQRQTFSVITYSDMHVVVPSVDIKPHTLDSLTCACEPRVEPMDDGFPQVIHDSWEDKQRIADSMSKIVG